MTLEEYLFENGLYVYEFAQLIGCCPNYISGIKNGTRKPTKRLRHKILKATEGKVVLDLLFPERLKLRKESTQRIKDSLSKIKEKK